MHSNKTDEKFMNGGPVVFYKITFFDIFLGS